MILTREEAINEHRKMWRWIAKKTLQKGFKVSKRSYLFTFEFGYSDLKNDCFLCEYSKNRFYSERLEGCESMCKFCPLDWGDTKNCVSCYGLNGLFDKWVHEDDYKKAALLAYKISKLPEKEIEI